MLRGTLADAMKGADVFIGVSVANCVTKDMVRSMAEKPILFTCANPVPEINPADAKEAGAFIVGTGASQYANQINNVLVFPGLFRGALDVRARTVNKEMMMAASKGIIVEGDTRFTLPQQELAKITNRGMLTGTLADAMKGADVFVGVSVANCVTKDMVRSMAEKPILFTCANPVPEISPEDAKEAGAFIVGTGASQYANQINNVLVFPGLFRGALDVRARTVNKEMMMAASRGIAACVSDEELSVDYILPYAYDKRAHESVAKAVAEAAIATGVNKI
jgi:malate dehydrogenase (oxaloacetate-decarboxylating)